MRDSPGLLQRWVAPIRDHDIVRGGICLTLMAVLTVVGWNLWVALTVPFAVYAGLRLAIPSDPEPPEGGVAAAAGTVFATCTLLHAEIESLAAHVTDPAFAAQVGRIAARTRQTLAAIAEDGKDQAAGPMLELLDSTRDWLDRYVRVIRRGYDAEEMRPRVAANLSTIEDACDRFWMQLNRDAIVDIGVLGKTADVDLAPLSLSATSELPPIGPDHDLATLPPETGEVPAAIADGHVVAHAAGLTRREREVLCLLAQAQTDQQIADALFLSRRTVTTHVTHICDKLGVDSRTGAALHAVRHGLC